MTLDPYVAARNLREDCTTAIGHLTRTTDYLYWARTLATSIDPALRRRVDTLISDAHTLKVAISALAVEAENSVDRGGR